MPLNIRLGYFTPGSAPGGGPLASPLPEVESGKSTGLNQLVPEEKAWVLEMEEVALVCLSGPSVP